MHEAAPSLPLPPALGHFQHGLNMNRLHKKTVKPVANIDEFTFRNAHANVSTGVDKHTKYLYRLPSKSEPGTGRYRTYNKKRGTLLKLFNRKLIKNTNADYKAAALRLKQGNPQAEIYPSIAYILESKDCSKLAKMGKHHLTVLAQEEERQYAARLAATQQAQTRIPLQPEAGQLPLTIAATTPPLSPREGSPRVHPQRIARKKTGQAGTVSSTRARAARPAAVLNPRSPTLNSTWTANFEVPEAFLSDLESDLERDL